MIEQWDIVNEHGNRTGKTIPKGTPMKKDEYHLSVSVWIQNDDGKYLISQRAPGKLAPDMWETTGGAAISGEDSLSAALRETKEELGITLYPQNGKVFKSYTYPHSSGDGAAYIEVWLFRQNIDIDTIVLQKEETRDVKWASKEQIKQMMDQNIFIKFDYIDELFAQS